MIHQSNQHQNKNKFILHDGNDKTKICFTKTVIRLFPTNTILINFKHNSLYVIYLLYN